jgi:hypothetical protein
MPPKIPIHVSAAVPPDTIHFVVPRQCEIFTLPDGSKVEYYAETEEQWARKCGMITGVGTE